VLNFIYPFDFGSMEHRSGRAVNARKLDVATDNRK